MIKSTINSFTENISQKVRNPFLGTFIIVWVIRNWKFVYSLFYFDSKFTLDDKIERIQTYFIDYSFLEILITVGLSFLILTGTYILLNLSRLIVNFFDKMITPQVYKITDKSSVVLKSTHEAINKKLEQLEAKVQSERELRLKAQSENEQLENRIKELIAPKIEESKEEKQSIDKQNNNFRNKTQLLSKKLIKENKVESFESVASDILNGYSMLKDRNNVEEFTTLGLIKPGNYDRDNKYNFTLTQSGKDIHENLILEKLK